jgi:hypothetical protein
VAVAIWLVAVLFIAIVASVLPAREAMAVSVRESLPFS